jgi:predicted dienelactone hydrolase
MPREKLILRRVLCRALFSLVLVSVSNPVLSAGFRFLAENEQDGTRLTGAIWHPCEKPEQELVLGPLVIQAALDCDIKATSLPLIVISHGSGASALSHHSTARALADAGFVVAALNHRGDNFRDLSQQGSVGVFESRAQDVSRLVDFLLHRWSDRSRLDSTKVGLFGFSRGGSTGLLLAGARPDYVNGFTFCEHNPTLPICDEDHRKRVSPRAVQDPRIRALAIADPVGVFTQDGLSYVRIPIHFWASEHGGDGIVPVTTQDIGRWLPNTQSVNVVEGAGHYGFLPTCSQAFEADNPMACRDKPGFSRAHFQSRFEAALVAFYRSAFQSTARN